MLSRLFRVARASLAKDERKSFLKFAAWLRRLHGGRLFRNLQAESHLAGDKDFGDPEEFASFLKRCAGGHAKAKTKTRELQSHVSACSAHELRGLRIPMAHLPPELLRYSASTGLAAVLVERTLGAPARAALMGGTLDHADASKRLATRWDRARLRDTDTLGDRKKKRVFATFEHAAGAPRNDAPDLAQALALPVRGDEILVEFAYPTDSVKNHRFPTVADAGDYPLFEPAREVASDPAVPQTCTGWTEPLGKQPPQPEIVHQNGSLRVLSRAPRFVGRIRT